MKNVEQTQKIESSKTGRTLHVGCLGNSVQQLLICQSERSQEKSQDRFTIHNSNEITNVVHLPHWHHWGREQWLLSVLQEKRTCFCMLRKNTINPKLPETGFASICYQYVHIFQDSVMITIIFFISKCFRFGIFHHVFNYHQADDQSWKYETPAVLTNMLMLHSHASASHLSFSRWHTNNFLVFFLSCEHSVVTKPQRRTCIKTWRTS